MDPDGQSLILSAILFLLSLLSARALGAFSEIDGEEDDDAALLGLTPLTGAAAVAAVLLLAGAVFCAAGWLRALPWAALAAALLGPVLYMLAF